MWASNPNRPLGRETKDEGPIFRGNRSASAAEEGGNRRTERLRDSGLSLGLVREAQDEGREARKEAQA